jgi:hypothetical protein
MGLLDQLPRLPIAHAPKGDGPFVQLLKSGTVVPNLTELSKKNNGVFPFARVFETIDGMVLVMAHGPTDMPILARMPYGSRHWHRSAPKYQPRRMRRRRGRAIWPAHN